MLAVICNPSIDRYSADRQDATWLVPRFIRTERLKGRWRTWSTGNSASKDWPVLSKMHQVQFNDKPEWHKFDTLVFISFFETLQRDCSVDNVTRRQVRWSGVRFPSGARYIFLSKISENCLETYQPLIQWALGIHSIIKIKQPDCKFDHLTIVEFKNEWSLTYTSLLCLEDVDRDNVTFTLPFSWQNLKYSFTRHHVSTGSWPANSEALSFVRARIQRFGGETSWSTSIW